jgi:hypothetical protein
MKKYMKGSIYDKCTQNGIKFKRAGKMNVFTKNDIIVKIPFTLNYDSVFKILSDYFPELLEKKSNCILINTGKIECKNDGY